MKKKALLAAAADIRNLPDEFDQDDADKCIIGKARKRAGLRGGAHGGFRKRGRVERDDLGLTRKQHFALCALENWPLVFLRRFNRARSNRGRANAAADRTVFFVKTNGRDSHI